MLQPLGKVVYSSVSMKYWRKQDFQNLKVEVLEGHLNMVSKIRTPDVKSERKLSSLTERQPDESPRKSRREISAAFNAFHDEAIILRNAA